jgi:dTDP-4-dehydrorhamnose reductase
MKVLLIGGSGQLGTEIRARWTDCEILAPAHDTLDLTDAQQLTQMISELGCDLVVNCAAFHNVDRCEEEPFRAFEVNAVAVDGLARICAQHGSTLVTVSTDYVFSGEAKRPYNEDDAPRPISAYGTSKLAGELLVARLEGKAFVVRTCGVYGRRPSASKGHTFIDRVVSQAHGGEPLRIVSDVVASPTYAGHLAVALRQLVETGAYGLYHACNVGPVSWYDFASEALRQAGVTGEIEAISASSWKAAARRPQYSALANTKLDALGIRMPRWQDGIAEYLRDRAPSAL